MVKKTDRKMERQRSKEYAISFMNLQKCTSYHFESKLRKNLITFDLN